MSCDREAQFHGIGCGLSFPEIGADAELDGTPPAAIFRVGRGSVLVAEVEAGNTWQRRHRDRCRFAEYRFSRAETAQIHGTPSPAPRCRPAASRRGSAAARWPWAAPRARPL